MAEIYADLLTLIEAMDVAAAAAISSIHLAPDRGDYLASISLVRVNSHRVDDADSDAVRSAVSKRLAVPVYRISGRAPIAAHLAALNDSGLLGNLNIMRTRSFDADQHRGEYVARTHAGSLEERIQWLLDLSGDSTKEGD